MGRCHYPAILSGPFALLPLADLAELFDNGQRDGELSALVGLLQEVSSWSRLVVPLDVYTCIELSVAISNVGVVTVSTLLL